MGDFTSKYRVTYSDGSSGVESRIDGGKLFDNAFVPLIMLVIVIFILIAAMPILVLIPLFLYLLMPYRKLAPVLKSNPDAHTFTNADLTSHGFKNAAHLHKSNKLKILILILPILVIIGMIEYSVFSHGIGNDLVQLALQMLAPSLMLVAFFYPLGYFVMQKNRAATRALLDIKPSFMSRMLNPFIRAARYLNKKLKWLYYALGIALIPIVIGFATLEFVMSGIYESSSKLNSLVYVFLDKDTTQDEAKERVTYYLTQLDKNINDTIAGNAWVYQAAAATIDNPYIGGFSERYFRPTQGETLLGNLVSVPYYQHGSYGNYKEDYQRVDRVLTLYEALGGDINVKNTVTGEAAVAETSSIEIYDALVKRGVSFKGYEQQVVMNVLYHLGHLNKGYSKRLAGFIKNIGLSQEQAQQILGEELGDLKYYDHAPAINALQAIAKKP